MSWGRNAALSPFVKTLNIEYSICTHICCWDTDKERHLSTVVRLHTPAICKVIFLTYVKAGFVCTPVFVQLLYQVKAVIILDYWLVKPLFSCIMPFSVRIFVPTVPVCTCISKCLDKFICGHESHWPEVFLRGIIENKCTCTMYKYVSRSWKRRIILMALFQGYFFYVTLMSSQSYCVWDPLARRKALLDLPPVK